MKTKKISRKLCALTLVASMVSINTAPAQAAGNSSSAPATQPARFTAPAVLKDANGHTYDLGGMEIIVRDWWSGPFAQSDEQTEYDLAREEYIDWIQETYNFKISRKLISAWSDVPQDFIDYASAPADDKNYVFVLREDPLTTEAMRNGLCADLNKLSCLDFSEQKFQRNLIHLRYSYGDAVYAMQDGYSEANTGVYFNKRLLQEAGVDPDSIYDMQLNGTWTWEAFETLCKKVARNTNNEDENGWHVLGAYYPELARHAVYSNGGNFVSKDANGKFINSLKEEATLEGLQFARKLMNNYWLKLPDGAEWDYYKDAFKRGEYVFCVDDAWALGNILREATYDGNGNIVTPGMTDPVGYVMFPKGPKASDYVSLWGEDFRHAFTCIPSNYDAERTWKIAFAWNLYTNEVPGYENSGEWKVGYEPYFDQRAIDETFSIMRTNGTIDCCSAIPEINRELDLTYKMWYPQTAFDGILDECSRKWDYLVKRENGEQFPAVKKDANGKTIDLGGMEIVIADWWSEEEKPTGSVAELAKKEYLDWIQKTYNFKISSQHVYEWDKANKTAVNYANSGGDAKNYLFTIHEDNDILNSMKDGKFYDLSSLNCLDFSKEKFQENPAHKRWSYKNGIYAMNADRDESRQGVLFNKGLLYAAGIDPDSIYDMQADGTWTWDKFEELCQKVTRDVNNDGVTDIYGCAGYQLSIAESATYSNGGAYVGKDQYGKFTYNVEDPATVEALEFTKRLVDSDYWRPEPEGASWDYYEDAFCNGEIAFMPGGNFSKYSSIWNYFTRGDVGFVLFPKGPRGENYANFVGSNAVAIPSCYDADRAWKIAFAWDLYTDGPYAYDENWDWIKAYEKYADDRTLYETFFMPIKGIVSCEDLIPNIMFNDVFIWEIKQGGPSISELIDANHARFENAIRKANDEAPIDEDLSLTITNRNLTLYDAITIEFKMPAGLSNEGYHDPYLLVRMNGEQKILHPREKDGMLIYTLGVPPHKLGDEVVVEPHALDDQGQEVVGKRMRYSAKQYCMNILTKSLYSGADYADLRKLCVDILMYGDAAQKFDNYKTDKLASADLTKAQKQQGTDPTVEMTFKSVRNRYYATVDDPVKLADIPTVALYLDGKVNIQFKVEATKLDGLKVVVTDGTTVLDEYPIDPEEKDKKGRYVVYCDHLNAGEMKKAVYGTVMKDGQPVSNTFSYSIESYVKSMLGRDSEELDELLLAMMRYGNSAEEYVENHPQ